MSDGKQRARILDDFDLDLNAPIGGWEAADQQMRQAIFTADG